MNPVAAKTSIQPLRKGSMRKQFIWISMILGPLLVACSGYYFLSRSTVGTEVIVDIPVVPASDAPLNVSADLEKLAQTDPVEFLHQCLLHYQRDVKGGFHSLLAKHEWVNGKQLPPEEIEIYVRGDVPNPESRKTETEVLMRWKSGKQRILGSELDSILYSEKISLENMTTWRSQAPFFKEKEVSVTSSDARKAARYCIRDAGIYHVMLRTYEVWKQRQAAGELDTKYLGRKPIDDLGEVECYVIKRECRQTELDAFELGGSVEPKQDVVNRDGFNELTIMVDVKNWLQVGTVLKQRDGKMMGEYYYRNVELNPEVPAEAFEKSGWLKR